MKIIKLFKKMQVQIRKELNKQIILINKKLNLKKYKVQISKQNLQK